MSEGLRLKIADFYPSGAETPERAAGLFGMEVKAKLADVWPEGLHPMNAVCVVTVVNKSDATD